MLIMMMVILIVMLVVVRVDGDEGDGGAGMNGDDAVEHFYFNVLGSYVGDYTPCFITKLND